MAAQGITGIGVRYSGRAVANRHGIGHVSSTAKPVHASENSAHLRLDLYNNSWQACVRAASPSPPPFFDGHCKRRYRCRLNYHPHEDGAPSQGNNISARLLPCNQAGRRGGRLLPEQMGSIPAVKRACLAQASAGWPLRHTWRYGPPFQCAAAAGKCPLCWWRGGRTPDLWVRLGYRRYPPSC